MSNYSDDPSSVRIDLFKPSGKWAYTVGLIWRDYTTLDPYQTLRIHIKEQYGDSFKGMNAVCLNPYCEHPYPVMAKL